MFVKKVLRWQLYTTIERRVYPTRTRLRFKVTNLKTSPTHPKICPCRTVIRRKGYVFLLKFF